MLRRLARIAAPAIALSAAVAVSSAPAANAVIPLKNQAMITKAKGGYLFRAGQQDSHLVITRVTGGVRFADSGTARWKSLPAACHRQQVRTGIAAVCNVPGTVSRSHPMTLQLWTRLGDDYIDGRSLSAAFRLSVLADAGNDVVYGGAGNDILSGGPGNDTIYGGPGHNKIGCGPGNDTAYIHAGDTVRDCEHVHRR